MVDGKVAETEQPAETEEELAQLISWGAVEMYNSMFYGPEKKVELNWIADLDTYTPVRKKQWCVDWNPVPTREYGSVARLRSPEEVAAFQACLKREDEAVKKFTKFINKWALASCGEDGLTIWDEEGFGDQRRYNKQVKLDGEYRLCAWNPSGKMIAGGMLSGKDEPEGHVLIWNYSNEKWKKHPIFLEDCSADVVGLSWNKNKLLCCTTNGFFYVIEVEMSGGHHILATHHDDTNAEINFVKWHRAHSDYFICGGHRGLEVYRFLKTSQELSCKIEKAAIRTSTTAAAGICFSPDNSYMDDFIVFKYSGGITTWSLKIIKDYLGRDLISLNVLDKHGKRQKREDHVKTPTEAYCSFDWLQQGVPYFALGREDGNIEIYTCEESLCDVYHSMGVFPAHNDTIACVRWSQSSGGFLASASYDGTIKIWKADDATDYFDTSRHVTDVYDSE